MPNHKPRGESRKSKSANAKKPAAPQLAAAKFADPAAAMQLDYDRQLRRSAAVITNLKQSLAAAIHENDSLLADKTLLLGLNDRANASHWSRTPKVTRGEAAAVLLLSDLHLEEVVKPETVNDLNEFNPKIAAASLRNVTDRFIRIVEHQYRSLSTVDECVVWLGGDLLSGHIHEELLEGNAMSPIEACIFAEELLERSLRTLITDGGFKKITIVCSSGNHDRTTHKTRSATRHANSYSTLVYQHLRARLANYHDRLTWLIAGGEFAYVDVMNMTLRMTHGDSVKYQGGLAGLSAPLNRSISRWDRGRKADMTLLGHFHVWEWSRPGRFLVNGSLIGTSPYGLKFGYSDPCQTAMLITRKHGIVNACPVFAR